jgi:hypothetical protein
MNWKGIRRKRSWPNLGSIPASVRKEENYKKPQSGELASWPRLEASNSCIQFLNITATPSGLVSIQLKILTFNHMLLIRYL